MQRERRAASAARAVPTRRPAAPKPARGRPFERGSANFTSQFYAQKATAEAERASAAAAAAALVAAQTPSSGGSARAPRVAGGPLNSREKARLRERYAELGDAGVAQIAAELHVHRTTVKRHREEEDLGPETPPEDRATVRAEKRRRRGGRPRACSDADLDVLRAAVKKDPSGGRSRAAAALARAGGPKLSRWTLARMLSVGWPGARRGITKRPTQRYVELSEQELDMQFHHLEGLKEWLGDRETHPKRYTRRSRLLYFQDETYYIPGCVARQGYGAAQINMNEKHSRHGSGEKVNIWGVHNVDGWVKVRHCEARCLRLSDTHSFRFGAGLGHAGER